MPKPGMSWSDWMTKNSKRLGEHQWSLWVDSRHRMTIPNDLLVAMGWQGGDTLTWNVMDDGSVQVQSLDRDLRVRLAELEGLHGASKGSPQADRMEALAMEIDELSERLYPLDASSPQAASAQLAFAEAQTREKLMRNKATDRVNAILTSLEARRMTYRAIQDLKQLAKPRSQR
jgi:bifunctional DNA-binding transcriptional regulator/antitoxin component of YhaV-PrlF toxin-antitoxin module